jgi:transposase
MGADPFSGSVYLFCSRDRRLLKTVWRDWTGFWLSQKRPTRDKFPWPDTAEAARDLSAEQARMLLAGIDFFKEHQPLQRRQVS